MAKMIISTTAWPRSPVVSWLFLFLFFVPSTQTAAGGGKLFFSSIRRYTGISISAYAFYPHVRKSNSPQPMPPLPCLRSTFDKRLAAGFRRHLTLGKLSGDVKSKFTVQDGSRIIASCLVGLDGPGGHQNWAKLSTPNRTQQTQLFPLKKKKLISQSP
ncbi:putative NADH dehydrogenase [Trichinella spiralis]|uniref:putative NADH dehydrogenase n=1 Tax=Trichinella spiralis TaxID=6334 RepID=UPI0001EFDC81|nr:putative NADH dehydrogenase [Trichinella spiralis]